MPPDHSNLCSKCSKKLPCRYNPLPNPNPPVPLPVVKKQPKFVSRPDIYQIIGTYFTYSFPPRLQPAAASSKDAEKDKAIYAEAQRLPWAHYDRLRRFVRLFRRQVSRAEPGAFKEAIDKLEDKAIAWVIELDKIEEVRKRWFKEED